MFTAMSRWNVGLRDSEVQVNRLSGPDSMDDSGEFVSFSDTLLV